jgi:hypothetical protein
MFSKFLCNIAETIENEFWESYPAQFKKNILENKSGFEISFSNGHINCTFTPIANGNRVDCNITADNQDDREAAAEMRVERFGCPFINIDTPIPSYKTKSRDYTFYFSHEETPEYIGKYLVGCHSKMIMDLQFS